MLRIPAYRSLPKVLATFGVLLFAAFVSRGQDLEYNLRDLKNRAFKIAHVGQMHTSARSANGIVCIGSVLITAFSVRPTFKERQFRTLIRDVKQRLSGFDVMVWVFSEKTVALNFLNLKDDEARLRSMTGMYISLEMQKVEIARVYPRGISLEEIEELSRHVNDRLF